MNHSLTASLLVFTVLLCSLQACKNGSPPESQLAAFDGQACFNIPGCSSPQKMLLGNTPSDCQAACTNSCGIDENSCAGYCSGNPLAARGTLCSSSCVDLKSDPNNCSACGKQCAACANGICIPAEGLSCSTESCEVFSFFPPHKREVLDATCCKENTPFCIVGTCECKIGSYARSCGNATCTDLTADPNNCGKCGHHCEAGDSGGEASCVNGQCGIKCPDDFTLCSGKCVDLKTDLKNCGACDRPCDCSQQGGDGAGCCVGGLSVGSSCQHDVECCQYTNPKADENACVAQLSGGHACGGK
jgi:hypothetical protein